MNSEKTERQLAVIGRRLSALETGVRDLTLTLGNLLGDTLGDEQAIEEIVEE